MIEFAIVVALIVNQPPIEAAAPCSAAAAANRYLSPLAHPAAPVNESRRR
jgi:hypothetical protein